LYNQRPGYTYLSNYQTFVTENGIDGFANSLAASFASSTDAELAAIVTGNLGLTGDAVTAGNAYLEGQFAAAPAARGKVILDAMNALATLENDATYGAAAAAFNADVAGSLVYSQDSTNTTVTDSYVDPSAGQIISLTSATAGDDLTGSANADTFQSISSARLQDADVLDGAGGIDTLNAKVNSTTAHDASINDIEIINYTMLAATTILGTNISGATNINVSGGKLFTYTGLDGETISLSDKGTGLTTTDSNADTTTDAITVELKSGALGTLTLGDTAATDYETINLVLSGATAATLTEAGTPDFTDSDETINISGSGDFVLTIDDEEIGSSAATIAAGDAVIINAADHTGSLTLALGAIGTPATDDKDWFSAEKLTGVDVITFGTNSGSAGTTTIEHVLSGTELVVVSAEAATDIVTATQRGTATDDTLTVSLKHGTAGSEIDIAGLVTDGFETVTVNSTGTVGTSGVSATDAVNNVIDDIAGLTTDTTLNITGDAKLTATGIESTFTKITVTNTKETDLTVDAGGALTYVGGTANDRLVLATVADIASTDSLDGGAGTDTLAISAAGALEGADFTTAQRAAFSNYEVIEFVGAQNLTSAGIGTDTWDLSLTGASKILMTGAVTTDANDLLVLKVDSGDTVAFGAAVTMNTTLIDVQVNNAANAGTNDSVTLALEGEAAGASTAVAGITIDNVETLNIEVKGVFETSDVISLGDVDGAQLQTINISSTAGVTDAGVAKAAESLTITEIESSLLSRVDASAYTGVLDITTFADEYSALGATVIGGSGVDSITGGTGADVITGNDGADSLLGAGGNDNIDGGAGADTIDGEGGADILTGGAGDNKFVFVDGESTEALMDKITDFTAGAADADFDSLDLVLATDTVFHTLALASAHDVTNHTTETDSGAVTAYTTNGIISLSGASAANVDTLGEWIDIAEDVTVNGYVDNGGSDAGSETVVVAFEFDGNTYVVYGDDADSDNTYATEAVVELTGVTGITAISATEALNVIHVM